MMGILITLFARLGLPETLRKPLAYLATGLLVTALLWLLWAYLSAREKADDRANREIGAAIQREGDLAETINRTEQGNAAREEIRAPGDAGDRARYDQCVRSARTPANCVRFLPEQPADYD